ncbi:hypothetical protein OX90_02780 [Pseudomonas coronafaciens pv. porri]|uniref:Uncharacterized protein n=1 Tax=Pseudomonas coronafaciens pv. porri TaxID=83964 RepID=A0ABR5JU81_9PSED|nr:hypothetical protein OA77_25315 [Pseudomonas coronafaciens]KOP55563.1 hypothetical protein OX88_12645 [Pseudomonas coronafaciens pv. porri]KOP60955.1 hypothetical protein OX90_02780 [Pseudomonas coronafaciens pv. porri]
MNGGTSETKTEGTCEQMRRANTIHLHLGKDKSRGCELMLGLKQAGKAATNAAAVRVARGYCCLARSSHALYEEARTKQQLQAVIV